MRSQETRTPHKGEGHRSRLRQRFNQNGLEGFQDYEVVELLLTLNTPRRDCKDTAKSLLERFKTFQGVLEATAEDLESVKGVGPANSLGIKLIKEAADRYLKSRIISTDVVSNTRDLIRYLDHVIAGKAHEYFVGIFLNAKNRVIASETLFEGSLTSSAVYPREVIKRALGHNAAAMIFAHNHPSGEPQPSDSDLAITRKLLFALGYAGVMVHEHLIIGTVGHYSFAEQGHISVFNQEFRQENGQR
ncbi:MAG: DNA repair protein RadC [Desulfobacteraceae bacterium]|nr:MAG: DNA repair protein RadC [Desulfobacteraceae bacterium]